jgi:hypothetical protein
MARNTFENDPKYFANRTKYFFNGPTSSWQQLPAIEKKEKVVADVSWWEERVQEPHVLLLYDVDLPCFHRAESMELRSQRFIRLMRPKHGSCGNGFSGNNSLSWISYSSA